MQLEDMIMVSVDDHVVEPPDLFEQHLTPEYKDKAPKIRTLLERNRRYLDYGQYAKFRRKIIFNSPV